ncbi:LysE family transporter [Nonomuraea sp. NPDC049784]|uniref:LysE family transporter n=1 Tax=Nonomuraea sp. NPDC049784 TaxID=3154361 RepID=UPI0033DF83A8
MTGTRALIRLILRRDRVLLPVWIAISALLPASIASSTTALYADQAARDAFAAASMSNPAQLATRGPIYDASVGGLTAWTLGSSATLIGGLISILLVIRHTRVEEETGRRELLSSGVIGRHAPLAAALAVVLAANLLLGLLAVPALVGMSVIALAGTVAWFLVVANVVGTLHKVFARPAVRRIVDGLTGAALIALGVKLAAATHP